jgi:peptide/nickel transport system permease protein
MHDTYWKVVWKQYRKSRVGVSALCLLGVLSLIGIYAPLFASAKPLVVVWNHQIYFPLLRYLFFTGFYTKPIDLFFNLLMLTLPVAFLSRLFLRVRLWWIGAVFLQMGLFFWLILNPIKDPAYQERKAIATESYRFHGDPLIAPLPAQKSWELELQALTPYSKLNQLLEYRYLKMQHERLSRYFTHFSERMGRDPPTLWLVRQRNLTTQKEQLQQIMQDSEKLYAVSKQQLPELVNAYLPFSHSLMLAKVALQRGEGQELEKIIKEASDQRIALENTRAHMIQFEKAFADAKYLDDKEKWLNHENQKLTVLIPPLLKTFHWEDDAGGSQEANRFLPWWELTRLNRKDLIASLLFGIRISLVVGLCSILLALSIGIPLGLTAGYFAGKADLIICRLIEMWEAMPTFFMLLLIIAITQTKSIFLVISVLGMFGWTGMARFIRSEVLKQRNLPYVAACQSLGFANSRIMFSHILPNAIPPILTLLPFSIMGAITSEAGLSFLGLGEEGSTSWGVLMDEGRTVFPSESYLLWPPAILLTVLLISIALVGDRLRDAIDPKMH